MATMSDVRAVARETWRTDVDATFSLDLRGKRMAAYAWPAEGAAPRPTPISVEVAIDDLIVAGRSPRTVLALAKERACSLIINELNNRKE